MILALTHLSLHQDGQNRVPPEKKAKNKGKETKKQTGPGSTGISVVLYFSVKVGLGLLPLTIHFPNLGTS